MVLHETDGNPTPKGGSAAVITARDGVRLRVAHWPARRTPARGTVAVLQGRAEFIEKYFETIAELLGRGFAVATFDWRGQGLSQRLTGDPRKGHVGRFSDYDLDLSAFFAELMAHLPHPWFGLGHSMGGALLIDGLHSGVAPVKRAVASAPMLGIARIPRAAPVRLLAATLSLAGLGRRYTPGGGATSIMTKPFEGNPLSADAARYARNARIVGEHPELGIGDPTIGWLGGALGLMARLAAPRFPLDLRTPLIVLAAGEDQVVSTPAIEAFAARCRTGPAIILPGARHELLQERDAIRSGFWAAFDAFVPGS